MKYQKIVTGKTFNADAQLMDNVGEQVQGWVQHRFIENNEDYQITIVFCPISSRIGTDVEAAMTKVKGKGRIYYIGMIIAYHLSVIWSFIFSYHSLSLELQSSF